MNTSGLIFYLQCSAHSPDLYLITNATRPLKQNCKCPSTSKSANTPLIAFRSHKHDQSVLEVGQFDTPRELSLSFEVTDALEKGAVFETSLRSVLMGEINLPHSVLNSNCEKLSSFLLQYASNSLPSRVVFLILNSVSCCWPGHGSRTSSLIYLSGDGGLSSCL